MGGEKVRRKKRKKGMRSIHLRLMFIVAIVISTGFGYWIGKSTKNGEGEIESLQRSLAEKDNIIAGKNIQLNSLQDQIEDGQMFTKLYAKAMNHYMAEESNYALATSCYDWASYSYDYGDYQEAADYWTYAMDYFSYAEEEYRDAKALFGTAKDYAPNEDYQGLADKYFQLMESGAKIMSYMYEASEYYASASTYYFQGKWIEGDTQLEIGNERISAHDDEVPIYNDILSEIESIIEVL